MSTVASRIAEPGRRIFGPYRVEIVMEEIRDEEIEQISGGGTLQDQQMIRDFLDRLARERFPSPIPVHEPIVW